MLTYGDRGMGRERGDEAGGVVSGGGGGGGDTWNGTGGGGTDNGGRLAVKRVRCGQRLYALHRSPNAARGEIMAEVGIEACRRAL